ncbi:hypothetical protein D0T57_05020 [Dysgonomonas sp. 511]|nr:hypothetical protein [Dysgonomonas sp. 511]
MSIIIFSIFCLSLSVAGQTVYTGYVDKHPVELVISTIYSDGDARAIYAYSKYNTPIEINGNLKKKELRLYEKNNDDTDKAVFFFKNFDDKGQKLSGIWTNIETGKKLNVILNRQFSLDAEERHQWDTREILQKNSLDDKYFKLVISKDDGDLDSSASELKILKKSTGKLFQKIDLGYQLEGIDNIEIDDYNFDGYMDFSVFEASYAGPNTSSIYFLYDPATDSFFRSSFSGTSLSFDKEKKLIHEHNQCCAGRIHMNAIYKVEGNQMVLVKKTCREYNDDMADFIEVDCN